MRRRTTRSSRPRSTTPPGAEPAVPAPEETHDLTVDVVDELVDGQIDVRARRQGEEHDGGHDTGEGGGTFLARLRVAAEDRRHGVLGLAHDAERFGMVPVRGFGEHHLAQVGASVLDLNAVALDDRSQQCDDRRARIGSRFGRRDALLEGDGVVRVLHEQQQLALGLRVEEQGAGADIGSLGDLLGRDIVDAVLGEELRRRGRDPFEFLLLVALATTEGVRSGRRHTLPPGIETDYAQL